jgi:threonine/homoserine efflux transporter RhtA
LIFDNRFGNWAGLIVTMGDGMVWSQCIMMGFKAAGLDGRADVCVGVFVEATTFLYLVHAQKHVRAFVDYSCWKWDYEGASTFLDGRMDGFGWIGWI